MAPNLSSQVLWTPWGPQQRLGLPWCLRSWQLQVIFRTWYDIIWYHEHHLRLRWCFCLMMKWTICLGYRTNISVKPGLENSMSFNILKGFLNNTGMIILSSKLWTGQACTGRQRGSRKKATLEENSQLALDWKTSWYRKTSSPILFHADHSRRGTPQNPHLAPQWQLTKIRAKLPLQTPRESYECWAV